MIVLMLMERAEAKVRKTEFGVIIVVLYSTRFHKAASFFYFQCFSCVFMEKYTPSEQIEADRASNGRTSEQVREKEPFQ